MYMYQESADHEKEIKETVRSEEEIAECSYSESDLDNLDSIDAGNTKVVTDDSSANEHELSYNDDDLAAFLPTDSVDMNRSYNDEELEELLSQGSTRDSFIDTERFREYDVDHSYTEEEFDSLCSSYYSQTDSVLTSETSFSTQFDCSTPLKPVRQMDSSFSEEEWKSFLEHTSNEDEEMRPFPDDSDIDIDIDESYSDSDNFMSIDPEFYSNVFAVPKSSVVSKGHLPSRASSLLNKALDKKCVLECKKSKCNCGSNCVTFMTAREIYNIRERFWTKTRHSQSQYLIHTMGLETVKGRYTYLTLDNGIKVCKKAFASILKIDRKRLASSKKLNEKGAKVAADKMPRCVTSTTISTLAWLENYAKERGDRMPHSTDILLPYKTTKIAVYNSYKLDCGKQPCGKSQFFQLWKDHFPHLKIKEWNSFSVCSKCGGIEKKLEQTLKPWERRDLIQERQEHLERQKLERLHYYSKRDESRSDPEHYLSLIIDGMDQSKSNMPHFTGRQSKSINPADLLKTHITGVINHGQRRFETYVDYTQWPHDPNLTINILFLALQKSIMANDRLPGTLYLQADNCWRENKNKYVLAICELLVREKVFNEVHLSFLFVGHTHEDVDAAFSQISKRLRQEDVETYDNFIDFLPESKDVTVMFNVKAWLEPHLCEPLKHTAPLHFRFQRINDNDVKIHYKGLHNMPWIEYHGFFKSFPNGKKYLPTGTPKLLQPNIENINFDKLRKQVHVIQHMFSKSEYVDWWDTFIDKLTKEKYKEKAQWYLKLLPRQKKEKEIERTGDVLPPQIRKQLDKETAIPHVRVVKKSIIHTQKKNTSSKRKQQSSSQKKKKTKGRSRSQHSKGHTRKNKVKESQIVYYFISRTEEKKHIWFLILCECVSHLMLVYGFLFLWIEKVFMASTVVDMLKLLMLIDTFSKWLSYQLFCQAYVNITLYLPDIPIPQTEDVDKLCLSPYRNKKLCMC